jgi:tRNA threonylcarbamoyladenosine biosynthesis protein TsaB
MTILLAIETSTEMASVALHLNGALVSRELSGVETHSSGILPAVQHILDETKITLQQCDAIAFGCGPGAFTGVRTACGVVQGLAYGADLPVVPVVSLLAMAESARQANEGVNFVCVLDARMNEVYWAHYVYGDTGWEIVVPPSLSPALSAFSEAHQHVVKLVLGKGVTVPAEFFGLPHTDAMPHANSIAALALHDFKMGKQLRAEQAEPLYLRNKIALTSAERLREK